MKIRSNIVGYFDRRTPALLEAGRLAEQERLDRAIEAQFRANVKANWKERARVLGVPRPWLSPKPTPSGLLARHAD